MSGKALSAKRERFCQEYVIDLSAAQAARRAGYSARTSPQSAYQLLQAPEVAARISFLQAQIATKLQVSAETVIGELAKIGFANMEDYVRVTESGDTVVDLSSLDRDKWAAVQEITVDEYTDGRGEDARPVKRVKFKLADKRSALVDLGRHLGLFVDRIDIGEDLAAALDAARSRRQPRLT